MPRNRITRPQNIGANRNRSMRNNARRPGANMPFQGGLGQGVAPQGPGQPPTQGIQQCPPGQEPGRDPNTGAQICRPARANISGNVPVNNAQRAIAPGLDNSLYSGRSTDPRKGGRRKKMSGGLR